MPSGDEVPLVATIRMSGSADTARGPKAIGSRTAVSVMKNLVFIGAFILSCDVEGQNPSKKMEVFAARWGRRNPSGGAWSVKRETDRAVSESPPEFCGVFIFIIFVRISVFLLFILSMRRGGAKPFKCNEKSLPQGEISAQ